MAAFTLSSLIKFIGDLVNIKTTPARVLPQLLMEAASFNRPGLSAYDVAAKAIENNKKLGIPTEAPPYRDENLINAYTLNIVECVIDALKEEGAIQAYIPIGAINVESTGLSAGGPVTCIGQNTNPVIIKGIMQ